MSLNLKFKAWFYKLTGSTSTLYLRKVICPSKKLVKNQLSQLSLTDHQIGRAKSLICHQDLSATTINRRIKMGKPTAPKPVNGPSTTGNKSGGNRGNNPPQK